MRTFMLRVLMLFVLAGVSIAQDEGGDIVATEDEKQKTETNDNQETQQTLADETPDTFDPTEKLSEDIPVAFPVDI